MTDTVKLVIEIPKIDKELLDTDSCGESRKEAILFAVKNSTPLSEVLDEIKEEIDNLDMEYDCNTYYGGIFDALEIINKHISGEEGDSE